MKAPRRKVTVGFVAGAVLGAAGGMSTGPSDEEILQQVNEKAAAKITFIEDTVHRPVGKCLSCHMDGITTWSGN